MQNVLKKDLKVSSYKKCKVQLLSKATKAKQMSRANLLLQELNNGTHPSMLWTDEKLFTIQAVHIHQNDGIYAKSKDRFPVNMRLTLQRQKPVSVMVWGGVTATGLKTLLVFIDEGIKINKNTYLKLLKENLLPWINSTFGEGGITLQQDRATLANLVENWCKDNMAHFWTKEMWPPPSSPDLNPWTSVCGVFSKTRHIL